MTTYYISSGSGNDAYSGLSHSGPKKTIAAALALGTVADGDTIEIIDEETYPENNLNVIQPNLTIIHTASILGRPKINGGGAGSSRCFYLDSSGTTFQGLEMYNAVGAVYRAHTKGGQFHVTGCFIHSVQRLTSHVIIGDESNKTSINESILYFTKPVLFSNSPILISHSVTFRNCLITASATCADGLIGDYGDIRETVTASFCTFINTPGAATTDPIIRVGKVINCIVSGTGKGISSDDHTYTLVDVSSTNYRNHADGSNGSAGTGDADGVPIFVDGTAIGSGSSVATSFKLQSTSPAVGTGTPYNNITGSLAGDLRAPIVKNWSSYSTPPKPNFGASFEINKYSNLSEQHILGPVLSVSDYSMGAYAFTISGNYVGDVRGRKVDQAPFSLSIPGPPSLRGRSKAYITTRSNPDEVLSGSG